MKPAQETVAFPTIGTRIGGSVVSTALLADGIRRQGDLRPRIVLPTNAANAAVFDDLGLQIDSYALSASAVRALRGASGASGYLRALPALAGTYRLARRYLRAERPAIVHVNDDRTLLPWGAAARREAIPVVWHVRQERSSLALDRIRLTLVDRLVFVADANRRRFEGIDRLPPNVRVHNWIDLRRFSPPADRSAVKREHGFDPDLPLVGFVGNLVPRKRPEWPVEAARILRDAGRSMQLAVIGDDFSGGDHGDRLRTSVERAGMEDQVHLLGYRNDVADLMRAFDVLVLTSVPSGEAFPRAVVEAMASGAVVVATDVAGVGEAIRDGTDGLLCHPDDFDDFVVKLRRVLEDEALRERLQEAAVERARTSFSEEAGLPPILELYADLLEKR